METLCHFLIEKKKNALPEPPEGRHRPPEERYLYCSGDDTLLTSCSPHAKDTVKVHP